MKYICILFLLFCCNLSYSQFKLSGKVESTDHAGLPGAHVQLYRDSSLKKETSSGNEGSFLFEDLAEGKYRVAVSFTGMASRDTLIQLTKSAFITLTLVPGTVQLDSISIKAKQNFMTKKADRIVFQIDGSPLYANKSTGDILKSIPRLNVTRNAIEIRGSGPAAVMIDDRIIYLSSRDLLEYLNIFKDDIASVEIITNPPAKYDAQGSGLINIVTKKKKSYGLFGYVESSLTKNTFWENDETVNIGVRNKNFSLVSSLGGSFGAYRETTGANTTFFSPGETDWRDNALNKNKFSNGRFNLVAEWLLSKKTKLYSSYSVTDFNSTDFQSHRLQYLTNGALDSVGLTSGQSTSSGFTHIFNMGLNSVFGKKNNVFDASLDYVNKTSHQQNSSTTVNYLADVVTPTNTRYDLFSSGDIPKNVLAGKADLSFPAFMKGANLQTGIKYSLFNNNSRTDYDELINAVSVFNGIATRDTFHYREQDIAGYVSIDQDFKKWSLKAGLRYEETITDGTANEGQHRNTFGDFFPSVFIQRKITDGTSADISYSRRIVRPTLFDVNPFKFFTSIYSDYVGNPSLNPSLQDNFNFNFIFHSTYLFSAFYNITHSPIVSFPFNTEGNTIETRKENNGKLDNYGINLDMP